MKNKNLFNMMSLSIIMFGTVACNSNQSTNTSTNDTSKVVVDSTSIANGLKKFNDTVQHNVDSMQTVTKHRIDSSLSVTKHRIDSSLSVRKNLIKKNTSR